MIIGLSGKAGVGKDTAADYLVEKHGFVKVAMADLVKRMAQMAFKFTKDQLWGPSAERNKADLRYPEGWGVSAYQVHCIICNKTYTQPRLGSIMEKSGEKFEDTVCQTGQQHIIHSANLMGPMFLTPRKALQSLGTEWGRACYEDVWVDSAIDTAKKLVEQPGLTNQYKWQYLYSPEHGLYEEVEGPFFKPKGVVIPDVRFINEVRKIKDAGGKLVRIYRKGAELEGSAGKHSSETEQDLVKDSDFDFIVFNNTSIDDFSARMNDAIAVLR